MIRQQFHWHPQNLAASTITSGQIDLTWTDNSTNETGFKIERKTPTDSYAVLVTVGQNITSFQDTGLTPTTEYTYRVYSFNTGGNSVTYSNEASSTALGSSMMDIDGNIYEVVVIGTQTWMSQNLKTTKYANGDPVPNVTDATQWGDLTTGGWVYYNNDPGFDIPYGRLYNYYAVMDSRKLCPAGWHAPSDSEWNVLENFLGGAAVAGGKMKEAGTTHWIAPNTGADNSSGFGAIPGGDRRGATNALFEVQGALARHWTSTEVDGLNAYGRDIENISTYLSSNQFGKTYGFSVRCIKD